MAKRKFNKKDHVRTHYHGEGPVVIKTIDLIKILLLNKFAFGPKDSIEDENVDMLRARTTPKNVSVNHIAVVLDGEVQEVIRAQNKLAALLLSNPDFVEFDAHQQIQIGDFFVENRFVKREDHDQEN